MSIIEALVEWNTILNDIVWGLPVLVTFFAGGIATTIMLRFAEFRHFGTILRTPFEFRKGAPGKGEIKPLAALFTVAAGTIGVGNIAGVATAIASGGPGALFWLFLVALFGMSIKACEVGLALWTRKVSPDGRVERGGTMFYIERIPLIGPVLAMFFALFAWIAAFGIGNMTQANSVAQGAEYVAAAVGVSESGIYNIRITIGVLLMLLAGLVIIGGIKRISKVVSYVVPFMVVWYVIFGIGLIIYRIGELPWAISTVLTHAFTPHAAVGGFTGATVFMAFRYGLARGLFSNEAGMGSAPLVYAFSESDHPGRMAFFGMFEVLLDTFICLITGFVIIITRAYESGLTAAALTMEAFSSAYGMWSSIIIGVSLMLVAFSTILAWSFYGESTFKYFFSTKLKIISEKRAVLLYRIIWLPPLFLAAVGAEYLETIWAFADTFNGLMAVPNITAIIFFVPITMRMLKHYVWVYLPSLKKKSPDTDCDGETDDGKKNIFTRWYEAALRALMKKR